MAHEHAHIELLPHLFRQEYAKMTAVLCRHFGIAHIQIAEDIASDTFLTASESWAINGVPEQPRAWLYAVARNKMKDHLRRANIFLKRVKNHLDQDESSFDPEFEFSEEIIADSQLAMIFAVCNPSNAVQSQICLALQVLCGFSVEEIATAFLVNTETVKKRLHRARNNLRNNVFHIRALTKTDIRERLDTVLRTLYLLFNEGYYSNSNNHIVRKELCSEAMRLALVLSDNPLTDTPQVYALLALMCYQSSRLDARTGADGEFVRFDEQDRNRWDKDLIHRGNIYLIKACDGQTASGYHIEAGIAYWHTTSTDEGKWEQILSLYDRLLAIDYSPVAELNRAFAYSRVHGPEKALQQIGHLHPKQECYYHELSAYLYASLNTEIAIKHYYQAIKLAKSAAKRAILQKEVQRLLSAATPDSQLRNGPVRDSEG